MLRKTTLPAALLLMTTYCLSQSRESKLAQRVSFKIEHEPLANVLETNQKGLTHEWKIDIQNLTSRSNVIGEDFSRSLGAVVPTSFTGEIIPVLSYKLTF